MDDQAAQVLGEPVIDGVILLARGAAKKLRANSGAVGGGLLGSVVARAAGDKLSKDTTPSQPSPNDYSGGGYLAVTPSRLVLFSTEDGRFKQKLGSPLAVFSPGDVDCFEFGKAAAGVGTLDIVTASGDRWAFEYSKMVRKKLTRMAGAAGAAIVD